MNLKNPVWEIMNTDLISISSDTKLEKIKEIFKSNSFHHLLVKDENDQLKGIISTADLDRANLLPVQVGKLLAMHIMTISVTTITPDTLIEKALDLFLNNRFRALPVVDESGKAVGILTPIDLMQTLVNEGSFSIE